MQARLRKPQSLSFLGRAAGAGRGRRVGIAHPPGQGRRPWPGMLGRSPSAAAPRPAPAARPTKKGRARVPKKGFRRAIYRRVPESR